MEKRGIRNLMIDELHDILNAEEQIAQVLPEMARAAANPELKQAFEKHLKETRGQIQRLNKIFKILRIERKEKFCKAAKGLILESREMFKHFEKSSLRDSALIAKAQRIEHYEISVYGTLRTFAKELELSEVASLLQESLNEEANADKALTKIAEGGLFRSGINHQANTGYSRQNPSAHRPARRSKSSQARKTSVTSRQKTATTRRKTSTALSRTPAMRSITRTSSMSKKAMPSKLSTFAITKTTAKKKAPSVLSKSNALRRETALRNLSRARKSTAKSTSTRQYALR